MGAFGKPAPAARTLRVLSRLLCYPNAELRGQLEEMRAALLAENALMPSRRAEIDALIDTLSDTPALDAEAAYVQLFDRGRATSLHLFEHVHGDSRERGPAMIDLAQTYAQAGLFLAPAELPDYLPAVLEFVSTQPPREARAFLGEIAHILNALFGALQRQQSGYASLIGALIELAGEKAQPVAMHAAAAGQPPADAGQEESVDAAWAEPAAFEGCSTQGQARPGQPQPVRIVRRATPPNASSSSLSSSPPSSQRRAQPDQTHGAQR